jgi:hypothetical protein
MTRFICFLLLFPLLLLATGCRSDSVAPAVPTAPTILTQPSSQTIVVGQAATFTVAASGTLPLSYQWYWNGMPINVLRASFTTPPTIPSDDQSTLSVTVSNQAGSVTSEVATLSVPGSPRRPRPWDLRFKNVGVFPLPLVGVEYTNILGGMTMTFGNQVGTPLLLRGSGPYVPNGDPRNASWSFGIFLLPDGAPGRTTSYQTGDLSAFPSDLASLQGTNTVVTSLDLVEGQNAYCLQAIKTAGTDAYTFGSGTLAVGALQATATQQAAAGRVITAISLVGGQATFISYGCPADPTTVYEASVLPATPDTVANVAAGLAQQGYLITALGGNGTDGFLLVGTRVQGDTLSRPFEATSHFVADRGFALLGYIFNYDPGTATGTYIALYEQ